MRQVLFLLESQKISDSLCYICTEKNPQFSDILFNGSSVDYCGSCLELVQDSKGVTY